MSSTTISLFVGGGGLVVGALGLLWAIAGFRVNRRAIRDEKTDRREESEAAWSREWASQRPVVHPLALRDWVSSSGIYLNVRERLLPLKNAGKGPALGVRGEVVAEDGSRAEILAGTIAAGDLFDARVVPDIGSWADVAGVITYRDLAGGQYSVAFECSAPTSDELVFNIQDDAHTTPLELAELLSSGGEDAKPGVLKAASSAGTYPGGVPPRSEPTAEQAAALDVLAELLMRPRALGDLIGERFVWQPEPGSRANADLATRLIADPHNEPAVSRPRANASLYLSECSYLLYAFGVLCREREVFVAPRALSRAAVEHGVRAVLALDPRTDVRQRTALALLDDIISAHYSHQAVSKLVGKGTPQYAATSERKKALIKEATDSYGTSFVRASKLAEWSIDGVTQLPFGAAVDSWCVYRKAPILEGVYDALSLFAHPQSWAGHEEVSRDTGAGRAGLSTSIDTLRKLASIGIAAWLDGAKILTSYHGWELPELAVFGVDVGVLGDPDSAGSEGS